MKEYDCAVPAYIVCQTPKTMEIERDIIAIGWKEISAVIRDFLSA